MVVAPVAAKVMCQVQHPAERASLGQSDSQSPNDDVLIMLATPNTANVIPYCLLSICLASTPIASR